MALIVLGNLRKLESKIKIIKNITSKLCFCTKDDNRIGEKNTEANKISIPPEPTTCCMTGCSNCVWIKYAQELAQMFDDGDVIAKNKIMEKVTDPSMRAFLLMQLGLSENKN